MFEDERKEMNKEQDRLEDEIEKNHLLNNRRVHVIKGKLYLLLSALSIGKKLRINRDRATIDSLFQSLQELAHKLP